MLLDVLLAASLLRLTMHPSLRQHVAIALLVAVKWLLSVGLRRAAVARRPARRP